MIKPYYQDSAVTLYHGDNRIIVPQLGRFDLLLTDPPYGIGRDGGKISTSSHGGRKPYVFMGWDSKTPEPEFFGVLFGLTQNQIIWGANYFPAALPPRMGWLFWDKAQRICGSDGELAFTSYDSALRVITLNRVEIMLDGAVHPTQKPLKLFTQCLAHADRHKLVETVLDPWAGSGTTGRACKDLGKQCVMVEREEQYCEVIARRMQQEVLAL